MAKIVKENGRIVMPMTTQFGDIKYYFPGGRPQNGIYPTLASLSALPLLLSERLKVPDAEADVFCIIEAGFHTPQKVLCRLKMDAFQLSLIPGGGNKDIILDIVQVSEILTETVKHYDGWGAGILSDKYHQLGLCPVLIQNPSGQIQGNPQMIYASKKNPVPTAAFKQMVAALGVDSSVFPECFHFIVDLK